MADTSPFAFPGPSSKYHSRERSQSQQVARTKSAYIPRAPVLSTERRAHRKAHSHATASATATATIPPLTTPPTSRRDHDHDQKSALNSFSDCASAAMAEAPMNRYGPVTPVSKSTAASSRPTSSYKLEDSPFSDYFTDDGRSTSAHSSAYTVPSPETQQLLLRLNKLQSRLIRGESDSYALSIVGRKMNEIEMELDAIHSQTRLPPDMEDSGLFMDEEDEVEDGDESEGKDDTPNGHPSPSVDGAVSIVATHTKQNVRNVLLTEAQQVLASVTKAHEQLRQHQTELRELNDARIQQLEERDQRIENMNSSHIQQLEGRDRQIVELKSDLATGDSELQPLRLQLQTLEAEVEAINDDNSSPGSFEGNPLRSSRKGSRRGPRARLMEEMERWRLEWEDVQRRRSRRRRRKRDSILDAETAEDGQDDWKTETIQKGRARVQIISKRRHSWQEAQQPFGLDGAADVDELEPSKLSTHGLGISQPSSSSSSSSPSPSLEIADQSTQTESNSIPLSWLVSEDGIEEQVEGTDLEAHDADDCAITTSSEDNDGTDDDDDDEEEAAPAQTAWQDLWDGLASLAGMGEDKW